MMEGVHGKQILQISDELNGATFQNGKTLKILYLLRAGLVGRTNREYQKDNPDFMSHGMLDNEHMITMVEMKARCSSSTAAR